MIWHKTWDHSVLKQAILNAFLFSGTSPAVMKNEKKNQQLAVTELCLEIKTKLCFPLLI